MYVLDAKHKCSVNVAHILLCTHSSGQTRQLVLWLAIVGQLKDAQKYFGSLSRAQLLLNSTPTAVQVSFCSPGVHRHG